jgi:uncharacterized membrane protein
MSILLAFHVLFAVIWVGGMFFANQCVRPSIPRLDPTHRVVFLSAVWGRFFLYVLVAIPVMLVTGLGMIHEEGGFAHVRPYVHLMLGLGVLMMLLALHVYFAPLKRFQRAAAAGDLQAALSAAQGVRKLVLVNLCLGLIVVLVATVGRFWPT